MQLYYNVFSISADEHGYNMNAMKTSLSWCRAAGRKNINARAFYSLYLFIPAHIIYRAEIVIIARLDQLSAYIMIAVCIVADTHTHFAVVFALYRYPIFIEGAVIFSSWVFFSKTRRRRKNTSCAARVSDKNSSVRHFIAYLYIIILYTSCTSWTEKDCDCSTPFGCNPKWKQCLFKCIWYYILIYSNPDRRCPWDSLVIMRAVHYQV